MPQPVYQPKKKSSTGLIVGVVIAVIAMLAITAAALYFIMGQRTIVEADNAPLTVLPADSPEAESVADGIAQIPTVETAAPAQASSGGGEICELPRDPGVWNPYVDGPKTPCQTGAPTTSGTLEELGELGRVIGNRPMTGDPGLGWDLPGGGAAYSAQLPCDGRGLLILESVLVSPGSDAEGPVTQAIQKWKNQGAEQIGPVEYGGGCPSLRSTLNGQDIYPIFVDYGFNTSELCAASASYADSNPRILSDRAEYLSPC